MASRERLVALDALRGVAILAVLLFHFHRPTGIAPLDAVLAPFGAMGWAGVDLFFVLSGYLVGGIVLAQGASPAGFGWRRFLIRRAFRLWPVLYLYLLALLLVGYDAGRLWPAFLHLQNYADHGPSHLWSLAVEEHFYLAAAFVLPGLARAGPGRVFAVLAAVIATVTVLRIGALALGEPPRHAQWQTQFRADALAAGVLLAALRHYRPALFARLARPRIALLAVAAAGYAWLASDPAEVTRWGIGLTVAWTASAALVLAAAGSRSADPVLPMVALARLGLIAYPLYVWHASVGQASAALLAGAGIVHPALVIAGEIAGATLVAWAVHRLVELPFLALRDRPPLAAEPAPEALRAA